MVNNVWSTRTKIKVNLAWGGKVMKQYVKHFSLHNKKLVDA